MSWIKAKHVRNAGVGAAALAAACLMQWEGMDLTAKHQSIDPPGVITACIGETNYDRKDLKAGDKFTREQCKQRLLEDMPKYAVAVDKCIHVAMPDHRRAALISFAYNLGQRALCKSSVARYLNAGKVRQACDAMLLYNRANRKVLKGLDNRRRFEREWCLRED